MKEIHDNIEQLMRLNGYIDRLDPAFKNERVYYFDHTQPYQLGIAPSEQKFQNESRIGIGTVTEFQKYYNSTITDYLNRFIYENNPNMTRS